MPEKMEISYKGQGIKLTSDFKQWSNVFKVSKKRTLKWNFISN